MSKFAKAFEGGRSAWSRLLEKLGILCDPAGENPEQARLRALAKWRFILVRGVIGWGVPMFLWLALSNFRDDLKAAASLHESTVQRLFHSWLGAFCINAFFGIIVGFLAWRRVHSEVWPGAQPDPEAAITRLGPLGPSGQ
jgi:hypothetical protein